MSTRPAELVRGLGPWAATAIVVGTMIGTGVFLVPARMADATGAAGLVFAAWILGGLLSLAGALAYAELGATMPEAGGDYAYLRRGFGPPWGFLFGWMHSVLGRPASMAAIAAGLLRFTGFLIPAAAAPIFSTEFSLPYRAEPYVFNFTWAMPLAVVAIAVVTFINYLGVRLGGQVQVVLTLLKVGAVLAVVVFGFALADGSFEHFQPFKPGSFGLGLFGGFMVALAAALWAYDGWSNVNLVGAEVTDPQRNIPRALVGGVAAVGGVYLLANAVYFWVLPFETVAQSSSVASDAVRVFAGPEAARWITIAMVVSALGTLNSSILSGARVPYAMARDGLFFRVARGIHPLYRTPSRALVFQATIASALALTGTFEELLSLFIFAQWIFYALTVAAMFRLRRAAPELERPYRAWGYPLVPALFVLISLALTVSLWWADPLRCSVGLLLILSGLVFYRRWAARAASP